MRHVSILLAIFLLSAGVQAQTHYVGRPVETRVLRADTAFINTLNIGAFGDIVPETTNTYNLGQWDRIWDSIYVRYAVFTNAVPSTFEVDGAVVLNSTLYVGGDATLEDTTYFPPHIFSAAAGTDTTVLHGTWDFTGATTVGLSTGGMDVSDTIPPVIINVDLPGGLGYGLKVVGTAGDPPRIALQEDSTTVTIRSGYMSRVESGVNADQYIFPLGYGSDTLVVKGMLSDIGGGDMMRSDSGTYYQTKWMLSDSVKSRIKYSDTTSLVAMQWELDGKATLSSSATFAGAVSSASGGTTYSTLSSSAGNGILQLTNPTSTITTTYRPTYINYIISTTTDGRYYFPLRGSQATPMNDTLAILNGGQIFTSATWQGSKIDTTYLNMTNLGGRFVRWSDTTSTIAMQWELDKKLFSADTSVFKRKTDSINTDGYTTRATNRDTAAVLRALTYTRIPYSDTTSVIAMQWELDKKLFISDTSVFKRKADSVNVDGYTTRATLRDTSTAHRNLIYGRIPYTDTTTVVAMQWELDKKIWYSDTTSTIAMQWELDKKLFISDTSAFKRKSDSVNVDGYTTRATNRDTASVLRALAYTRIPYSDTTSVIAMQWELDKKLNTSAVGSAAYVDSTRLVTLDKTQTITGRKSFGDTVFAKSGIWIQNDVEGYEPGLTIYDPFSTTTTKYGNGGIGLDSYTLSLPTVSGTIALLNGGQTFSSATWQATDIDTTYLNTSQIYGRLKSAAYMDSTRVATLDKSQTFSGSQTFSSTVGFSSTVSFGASTATTALNAGRTLTGVSGGAGIAAYPQNYYQTASTSYNHAGMDNRIMLYVTNASKNTDYIYGIRNEVTLRGSQSQTAIYGGRFFIDLRDSTGSIDNAYNYYAAPRKIGTASGSMTNYYGFYSEHGSAFSSPTITNPYHFYGNGDYPSYLGGDLTVVDTVYVGTIKPTTDIDTVYLNMAQLDARYSGGPGGGDSSFVILQADTIKKFNNNRVTFADTARFNIALDTVNLNMDQIRAGMSSLGGGDMMRADSGTYYMTKWMLSDSVNGRIRYSDTTSLIAMQWELDKKLNISAVKSAAYMDSNRVLNIDTEQYITGSKAFTSADPPRVGTYGGDNGGELWFASPAGDGYLKLIAGTNPHTPDDDSLFLPWNEVSGKDTVATLKREQIFTVAQTFDANVYIPNDTLMLGTPMGGGSGIPSVIRFGSADNGYSTYLKNAFEQTADRTVKFPDTSGVIALVDGGQTFSSATWQGTDIDTTYLNMTQLDGRFLKDSDTTNLVAMQWELDLKAPLSHTQSLSTITAPTGDVSFAMTTRQLKYTWTTPATADGALELEVTGAFSGDLLHAHQSVGNPGWTHLIHLEATDADVQPLYINSANDSALYTNKSVYASKVAGADTIIAGTIGSKVGRLKFYNGSNNYSGTLNGIAFGADRSWDLPNASGTIALLDGAQSFTNATWAAGEVSPSSDLGFDLGKYNFRWDSTYFKTMRANTSYINNGVANAHTYSTFASSNTGSGDGKTGEVHVRLDDAGSEALTLSGFFGYGASNYVSFLAGSDRASLRLPMFFSSKNASNNTTTGFTVSGGTNAGKSSFGNNWAYNLGTVTIWDNAQGGNTAGISSLWIKAGPNQSTTKLFNITNFASDTPILTIDTVGNLTTTGRVKAANTDSLYMVDFPFSVDSSYINTTDTIIVHLPRFGFTIDSVGAYNIAAGAADVSYRFLYGTSTRSFTAVNTSAWQVTTVTTEQMLTTINNNAAPAKGVLAIVTTAVATKPKMTAFTIYGHR